MHYNSQPIFPIQPVQLAQFIAFQHKVGFKGSSIQTQIAGISFLQRIMGFPNPSEHLLIKKLLISVQKNSNTPDKRLPITLPLLRKLVSILPKVVLSKFDILLFQAMFLLAFYALLRVGEMSITKYGSANVIQFHDITLVRSNMKVSGILLQMRHYKHSPTTTSPLSIQASKDTDICPVHALYTYLRHRGTTPGPLFLSKDKQPISAAQFTATLHAATTLLGLDTHRYTPHSFRIGGASYAHENKVSEPQLKRLGRWRSSAYMRYIGGPIPAPTTR